jgi:hypothetical protein
MRLVMNYGGRKSLSKQEILTHPVMGRVLTDIESSLQS